MEILSIDSAPNCAGDTAAASHYSIPGLAFIVVGFLLIHWQKSMIDRRW